jgi:alpha-tubulin suppressor-like RCC1 family protein
MTLVATSGAAAATFNGGATVNFASLGAGGRNSCGVTTANVLFCWGYNGEGQLGIGKASQGSGSVFALPQPSAATGNLAFRQVVASLYHACAITLSGVGYCWGINIDGRLGNNTEVPSNEPAQVATPVSFQSVTVGRTHTCGLSFSNRVFCWGYALDGALGIGIPVADSAGEPPPDFKAVPIEADSGGVLGLRYSTLTAGGLHSCAITTPLLGSAAYCWGDDQSGQLGNGAVGQSFAYYSPKPVTGGLTFIAITAGYTHTCALAPGGIPYCWGGNTTGQLGDGSNTLRTAPTAVSGGLAFFGISAGMSHTCAVTAAGAVWCWGSNGSGQLGDGTTTNSNVPVLVTVAGGLAFKAVSAGDLHTCAVTTTNIAYCWGNNQYGQLGDGTQITRLVPTKVAFQP